MQKQNTVQSRVAYQKKNPVCALFFLVSGPAWVVVQLFFCGSVVALEPPRIVRILNKIDLGLARDTTVVDRTYLVDKGRLANISTNTEFNVYREIWPLGLSGPSVRLLIGKMAAEIVDTVSCIATFVANDESLRQPLIKYKNPMLGDLVVPHLAIDAGVMFDPGMFELKPGAVEELKKVADWVDMFRPEKLRIEGHTDSDGQAVVNQRLSTLRAKAVKQALVSQYQMGEEMIEAVGFGEQRPLVSNDSKRNKAMNRRIEIIIWE